MFKMIIYLIVGLIIGLLFDSPDEKDNYDFWTRLLTLVVMTLLWPIWVCLFVFIFIVEIRKDKKKSSGKNCK